MWTCAIIGLPGLGSSQAVAGIGDKPYVAFEKADGGFAVSTNGSSVPLCASPSDHAGVLRILKLFQQDVASVTGSAPEIVLSGLPAAKEFILVGTLGRSPLIDTLVRAGRLDVKGVAGQWETSVAQVLEKPFPGVDRVLVIAGSDKRGTTYGLLDLSEQIGVSPWYWWADVPAKRHAEVHVLPGRHILGPPSVKYRGIFLNDEWPSLTNWIRAKYGAVAPRSDPPVPEGVANYGHEFYERIFEVLLRLKGNYLWPAMWNNAFNEDDSLNPKLADEYGIVMGTSHQEPMLRAQKEWDRRYKKSHGSWNYARHADTLQDFWRDGIRRNRAYESIVTIGLRGADDTPMAEGGPKENMAMLEKIIDVQRKIIAEEMKTDAARVPQMWCLYKEVLEFYNAGMRVPDDVTLLWPDDNWGNNRRLPTAQERKRSGGAGIYYHFDYHGGPRSYQWINTNPIAKIWEQMSLAKEYGADRIWIVNVGHFKGYEIPMEYFMALAWNTSNWGADRVGEYTRLWAEREFGPAHADAIGEIAGKYAKFNGRRKPELLSPATYSLVNYHEAETVVAGFKAITRRAEEISATLSKPDQDAFYGLVLFPTKASALVNELYMAAGKNALYARQGRAATNAMAQETRALFSADTALMGHFNRVFMGGKWDHFMDQPHLGYTSWRDPPENSLKAIELKQIDVPAGAGLGVSVEGSERAWPGGNGEAVLPGFDPFNAQRRLIEVFNRGTDAFEFTATADKPWIILSAKGGTVRAQEKLWVSIDWNVARRGESSGKVVISGAGQRVDVGIRLSPLSNVKPDSLPAFFEGDGVVSAEAAHHTRITESGTNRWMHVEDYGNTLSGMRATSAVDAPAAVPGKDSPCLEYRMYLLASDSVEVTGIFGPTLNFLPGRDLRYAIAFDDAGPQTVTLVPKEFIAQHDNMDWEATVANNARHSRTTHRIVAPGYHTLKVWMVDPGVVLQKIVVNAGGLRPSYLGPPESVRVPAK